MAIRFAPSRPGAGFEAGGVLDESAPSASLAGRTDAATRTSRLAELDDDELIGLMRAWRRLESWCDAGLLATIAELARRRPAERTAPAPPGQFPAQVSEFASDEVAAALKVSAQTAVTFSDLAHDLAPRLPATFHALHHGTIDHLKARVIAEATRVLTDDQAREVEARIFPRAGQQHSGRRRAAVARAVQAVDPEAAAKRRAEAQKDPRVSRWQEDAGTAALAGFGLPPDEVLEADQRITDRALALRTAGLAGSLGQLRARAYLDTLLGQDSTPPAPSPPASSAGSGGPATPASPADPATPHADAAQQRRAAARLNLTVPLTTLLGLAAGPGGVAGFGPVDPDLARQLAALASAHPASRCCLTVTDADGRAIGHGCVPGPDALERLSARGLTLTIDPLARGSCDHRHQEAVTGRAGICSI